MNYTLKCYMYCSVTWYCSHAFFNVFNNGNAVPMRCSRFLTMGMVFARVPLEMTTAVRHCAEWCCTHQLILTKVTVWGETVRVGGDSGQRRRSLASMGWEQELRWTPVLHPGEWTVVEDVVDEELLADGRKTETHNIQQSINQSINQSMAEFMFRLEQRLTL